MYIFICVLISIHYVIIEYMFNAILIVNYKVVLFDILCESHQYSFVNANGTILQWLMSISINID